MTLALAVVAALGVGACASHIHNPNDKALAEQAQKQLQAVIKAEQERLAAMTSNHQKVYAIQTQARRELEDSATTGVSRLVLRLTWADFRSAVGTYDKPGTLVTNPQATRDGLLTKINTEFAEARALSADDAKTKKAADATLEEARAQLTRWNRRVAALEKFIEVAPAATALSDVKDFEGFKTTTKSLLARAGAEQVSYTDATGATRTTTLKAELDDLLDDARALRNGDAEAGAILAGLRDIVKPEAPGLVVTVAALAKDLAETQRTRTLSRISSLERRLAVVTGLDETVDLARELSRAGGAVASATDFANTVRVGETVSALSRSAAGGTDSLANVLEAIQAYIAIAGPLTARAQNATREDAYLQHVQSIEESANSIAQHQALVSRGLEGIAAYHAGGLKPEQIADLAHKALQLILLGVIAGGQ